MDVGIISWFIDRERTGIDNYVYNLICNLIKIGKAENLHLIHYKKCQDEIYTKTHDVIIPRIPPLTDILGLPYTIRECKLDILHVPAHWHTQIMPFFLNTKPKKILTIHDLTPILFPETHTKKTALLWNLTLKLIKNRADIIIADSQNTRNDCIRHLEIPEEKIKVIHLAPDEIYKPIENKQKIKQKLNRKYNIKTPFILYVGTLEKRKNIPTLIKAFHKLDTKYKLVIVGKRGWRYKKIFKVVNDLNLQKRVIFTGYTPQEDLINFYNLADVFVYPSIYEGFGLPPLEAMACGCPVITSNTSSLPEIIGEAGIMVNPYDVEALANAIQKVITDETLRKEMSEKSLKRVKSFSWRKTAKETWKVYRRVYHGG